MMSEVKLFKVNFYMKFPSSSSLACDEVVKADV